MVTIKSKPFYISEVFFGAYHHDTGHYHFEIKWEYYPGGTTRYEITWDEEPPGWKNDDNWKITDQITEELIAALEKVSKMHKYQ